MLRAALTAAAGSWGWAVVREGRCAPYWTEYVVTLNLGVRHILQAAFVIGGPCKLVGPTSRPEAHQKEIALPPLPSSPPVLSSPLLSPPPVRIGQLSFHSNCKPSSALPSSHTI